MNRLGRHVPVNRSSRWRQDAMAAALIVLFAMLPLSYALSAVAEADEAWQAIEERARGQTVYLHAWGGDSRINAHLAWAADQALRLHGITLAHVKTTDTADTVTRVQAEKAAGRDDNGAVDLIWINGENFVRMREQELLYGPWTTLLPNWRLLDFAGDPGMQFDFTQPIDGYELPWTRALLTLYYEAAVTAAPGTPMELLNWARAHPGRFTFPRPPDFLGTSLLKQLLLTLVADTTPFHSPPDPALMAQQTQPLWDYLDQLTPLLWRGGRAYPGNAPELRRLFADGEIELASSLNPAEVTMAVGRKEFPDTTRSAVFTAGGLSNTSYLAIPYNARAREGAMVVANLLISPGAQARQMAPEGWGTPTVLARSAFSPMQLSSQETKELMALYQDSRKLTEPHPLWHDYLERQWLERYGSGN